MVAAIAEDVDCRGDVCATRKPRRVSDDGQLRLLCDLLLAAFLNFQSKGEERFYLFDRLRLSLDLTDFQTSLAAITGVEQRDQRSSHYSHQMNELSD